MNKLAFSEYLNETMILEKKRIDKDDKISEGIFNFFTSSIQCTKVVSVNPSFCLHNTHVGRRY